jgi:hypothetical protein
MMKNREEMINHIDANYGNLLVNLYERWQDEKKYEDFNVF